MNWSGIGAIALALAVGLGAFGAHALRGKIDDYSMGIWEKAVFYQFVHAFALLVVPWIARAAGISGAGASRVCWLMAAGILLFSGSLYALALSGVRSLGAVTPLGGVAFLCGWLLLAWELFRRSA